MIRETHHFLCERGDCLAEVALTLTHEQYERRFYFGKKILSPCPVCGGDMYEVKEK